jgi:N-acetyl-anhydromuramyl-L-alanine amidase AmpD
MVELHDEAHHAYKGNTNSIGIEMVDDKPMLSAKESDAQYSARGSPGFTPKQEGVIIALVKTLIKKYDIKKILPHRNIAGGTLCPGNFFPLRKGEEGAAVGKAFTDWRTKNFGNQKSIRKIAYKFEGIRF